MRESGCFCLCVRAPGNFFEEMPNGLHEDFESKFDDTVRPLDTMLINGHCLDSLLVLGSEHNIVRCLIHCVNSHLYTRMHTHTHTHTHTLALHFLSCTTPPTRCGPSTTRRLPLCPHPCPTWGSTVNTVWVSSMCVRR